MGTYLYGIGPRTEKYIVEHPDLVIDGILDGYRNDGEFCGIPVLALGDISTQNSRIIVAARPASARIIHARIKEFCMERNVEIYDINGRRMENGEDVRRPEAEKIRVDTDKLHREIERHDVVSFDIFDTLLVRKCGAAEKVFAYVAIKNGLSGGFVGERIRAEKELSQTMAPKIEDIYRTLSERMQIPQEEGRRLLLEEIEAEKKFLVIREKLAEAFSYAQAKGKKIFLISDMYLSRKVLGQILSEKGIEGYDRLFVSCEHGTDKAGKLFHEALRKAEGKDMLHIGDDEYRDCECAERCGIDTFPVWTGAEDADCNLACPEAVGYSLLGPVLFSFALWLDARLREDGIKRVYFCARDGYLIKRVFDLVERDMEMLRLKEPVESRYLPVSRSLGTAACLWEEEDIHTAAGMSFDGEADEMLKRRFYLEEGEILPRGADTDFEEYLLRHAKAILKKSERLRENYRRYLEGTGINRTERTAVIDFVSTGTCQMCLERITGKHFYGYYYENVESGEPCKSRLRKKGFIQEVGGDEYSCDNYFDIETLIKETVPTLREISDTGTAVYGKECMGDSQKQIIKTVQEQAAEYVKDRLKLMPDKRFDPEEAGACVRRLRWVRTGFLDGDKDFVNYDAFSNREIRE